jgi:hypothetical protein
MKIVGIGLNKTGTKTLGTCLRHWNFRHVCFSPAAFDLWRRKEYAKLLEWVGNYDSYEDWPWPLIFRDIDRAYPGSKFILTRRSNPEVWFESLCKHAERIGITRYRKHIYGFEMPHGHKREHIRYYEEHLQAVRDHFKDRPEALLEVCWEEGSGWSELARFLDRPEPSIAFPHENKAPLIMSRKL